MKEFMLVATIASLSIASASLAWAQAAIQEPGAYAFYHPNGDVLRAGPGAYGSRAQPIGIAGAMGLAGVDRPVRVYGASPRRHRLNEHR
jgi:hypothetical protein